MSHVNVPRLIASGLLAGIIYNVGGLSVEVLIGLDQTYERYGIEPDFGLNILHIVMRFGLGLITAFLYVSMRPRFGANPATAALAGIIVWIVGFLIPSIRLAELNIFAAEETMWLTGGGLIETLCASFFGAWVYGGERQGREDYYQT